MHESNANKNYIHNLLLLITLLAFAGTVYYLYTLFYIGSSLSIPLISCFTVFSCSFFTLYLASVKPAKSTETPEMTDTIESSDVSKPQDDTSTAITKSEPIADTATETKSEVFALQNFLTNPSPSMELDIIKAIKDAMDSLTPFAEAQNIKLHLSTTNETILVMAEPESLRVLFRNIIDNSIKYMGRAGHMIITVSLLGDDIFIILKDTGKGLSEEETTHVFELNFQGSNRVSGNGLGLAQTKMIVEAFGGTIYAKSSLENGMAIYIQLPVSNSTNLS